MIKEEDLLPRTTAKYGIEYESIIVDKSTNDYICITEDKLYDSESRKYVSDNLNDLLFDFNVKHIFRYIPTLKCRRPGGESRRLEFASHAFSPTKLKPSLLFENLERLIEAFSEWTDEKYYLPDHGTITFLSDNKEQVYTTLTGGTHMTISFPLTIHDNIVTWKYFMWLFTGLVTMYQPIYIALNGAPSPHTKGSERQRTSASLVVGSSYIYDIFTPESERYEIFINSPSIDYGFPDYPNYAHWNDKTLDYKDGGPWRGASKSDIGNSYYGRSDVFRLRHNIGNIVDDIESRNKFINKQFYDSYKDFPGSIASMTSNLIEFRFFDNEPINHLLNKFNLLIRMADYAYEQAKDAEEAVGLEGLSRSLNTTIDDKLNIRMFVNKKPWHDAVLESMNEGLDATFSKEFIDECYEAFYLTDFQSTLENINEISAIELHKLFIEKMNTAEHHFSEYFQTDDPIPIHSKEHQIEKLKESTDIAEEKMKVYAEEKARKDEEERQRKEKLEEDQRNIIIGIITTNISTLDYTLTNIINEYIDIIKLAELLRYKIYVDNDTLKELIKYGAEEIIEDSLLNSTSDENLIKTLNEWIEESLLPDLREKEPRLRDREDTEDRNRERAQERERQIQQEIEKQEQQINFIQDIVIKNIRNLSDDQLRDSIPNTINTKKISDILREIIYVDKSTTAYIHVNASGYLYTSTLSGIMWNEISQDEQDQLIKWFRESLLPDLESNIPELYERSQPRTTTSQIPETTQGQINRIQIAIRNNVDNLNEELHDLIFNSISYEKISILLQKWIYEQSYTTSDIRDSANEIIDKTKFREFDEAEHSTIKFWIQGILIDVLKTVTPIQETRTLQTEEEPTTYVTELEAVESEERIENETSIILDIIKLNIENLENPEMRHIVLKYILLNSLTKELHELIYILKYNTLELREHSLALLIQEGFYDELEEDYVKDPEVISLLKIWIEDYLIPDLVKGTPLELGGLSALFG